jgi:GntR family transcriptional regulator, transcriptional repressor for pyruvate dehydrogenase complex
VCTIILDVPAKTRVTPQPPKPKGTPKARDPVDLAPSRPVTAGTRPNGAEYNSLARGSKISERVAATLVSDIVNEGLHGGDRLPNEAAMIARFGLGRGSIREALRILEVHGIITLRSGPGGGPIVNDVHPQDVARAFSLHLFQLRATMGELVTARRLLEPTVARLAAETQDPEGMERMREALAREDLIEPGDARYIQAANDFHWVLSSMTGNRVLNLVAMALKEMYTSRVVRGGLATETTAPDIKDEHRAIGEAVLMGDAPMAEKLASEHMDRYLGRVQSIPGFSESLITWG